MSYYNGKLFLSELSLQQELENIYCRIECASAPELMENILKELEEKKLVNRIYMKIESKAFNFFRDSTGMIGRFRELMMSNNPTNLPFLKKAEEELKALQIKKYEMEKEKMKKAHSTETKKRPTNKGITFYPLKNTLQSEVVVEKRTPDVYEQFFEAESAQHWSSMEPESMINKLIAWIRSIVAQPIVGKILTPIYEKLAKSDKNSFERQNILAFVEENDQLAQVFAHNEAERFLEVMGPKSYVENLSLLRKIHEKMRKFKTQRSKDATNDEEYGERSFEMVKFETEEEKDDLEEEFCEFRDEEDDERCSDSILSYSLLIHAQKTVWLLPKDLNYDPATKTPEKVAIGQLEDLSSEKTSRMMAELYNEIDEDYGAHNKVASMVQQEMRKLEDEEFKELNKLQKETIHRANRSEWRAIGMAMEFRQNHLQTVKNPPNINTHIEKKLMTLTLETDELKMKRESLEDETLKIEELLVENHLMRMEICGQISREDTTENQ